MINVKKRRRYLRFPKGKQKTSRSVFLRICYFLCGRSKSTLPSIKRKSCDESETNFLFLMKDQKIVFPLLKRIQFDILLEERREFLFPQRKERSSHPDKDNFLLLFFLKTYSRERRDVFLFFERKKISWSLKNTTKKFSFKKIDHFLLFHQRKKIHFYFLTVFHSRKGKDDFFLISRENDSSSSDLRNGRGFSYFRKALC